MEKEIWKDVIGYEGLYKVSNLGRVKSLPRNGTKKTENIMTGSDNGYGYLKVILSNKNKKTKYIHQLVAEAFLGHKSNKGVISIDHINSIKNDNRLENLQILSQRDNISKSKISNTLTNNVYKVGNKYRVMIYRKNQKSHIGYYETIDLAIASRNNELKNNKNEK